MITHGRWDSNPRPNLGKVVLNARPTGVRARSQVEV